jgi:hypothetical protein
MPRGLLHGQPSVTHSLSSESDFPQPRHSIGTVHPVLVSGSRIVVGAGFRTQSVWRHLPQDTFGPTSMIGPLYMHTGQ